MIQSSIEYSLNSNFLDVKESSKATTIERTHYLLKDKGMYLSSRLRYKSSCLLWRIDSIFFSGSYGVLEEIKTFDNV